jgi:hypothetical protein
MTLEPISRCGLKRLKHCLATSVLSTTLPAPLPSLPETESGTKCPLTSPTPPMSSSANRLNTVPAQRPTRSERRSRRSVYLQARASALYGVVTEYTLAESALATALLGSIGDTNAVILKTTYPAFKTYALTPRQIVDTMMAKHGIPTSDDINKLREPLSRALTSLSDLDMGNYLLASQRLTRSGQGETPYHYFELFFLVTVSGFPSVAHSMTKLKIST